MWDLLHRNDCDKNERLYHFWWYNVEAVKFEDLPDDWVCPLCGLGKVLFLLLFAQNFDNIKQM